MSGVGCQRGTDCRVGHCAGRQTQAGTEARPASAESSSRLPFLTPET